MKRTVAFLDLLGFKEFMTKDKEGAIRLLWNYEWIIAIKKIEEQRHPVDSYSKELQNLAEKQSASSFEYFLPFSDSIIITSQEKTKETFIKQLGTFVLDTFLFTAKEYRTSQSTTKVDMVHVIDNGDGTFNRKIVKERWFPTLFRGGVSFGDAEILEKCSIAAYKARESYSVAGKALIEAVELESKLRSPEIVLAKNVYDLLSEETKKKYIVQNNDVYEFLWSNLHYIEANDPGKELYKFSDLFIPAVNLWKTYSHRECSEIYFNLLKSIIKGTFLFFQDTLGSTKIRKTVKHHIEQSCIGDKEKYLLQ